MIHMEIGATKSVQERLKTTKIDEIKGASLVFCWDTHLVAVNLLYAELDRFYQNNMILDLLTLT